MPRGAPGGDVPMRQRTKSAPVRGGRLRSGSSAAPPGGNDRKKSLVLSTEETIAREGRKMHVLPPAGGAGPPCTPPLHHHHHHAAPTPPTPHAPADLADPISPAADCEAWLRHWASPAALASATAYFSSKATWGLQDFLLPQWGEEEGAVVLGQGGEGVAWLAVEKRRHIPVVLKELYEGGERESLIHSALEHESVLRFYTDFHDEERDSTFIVLEFCPGGTLFDALPDEGGLEEPVAAQVILTLARVLEHLHQLGVVYADLKTSNILIDACGDMKLADFGSSHFIANEKRKLTKTTGTVDTQPPEMVSRDSHADGGAAFTGFDKSVDNWSLGVLAYRLLVGGYPFSVDVDVDDDDTVIRSNIMSLSYDVPASLSDEALSFIEALLKADPADRLSLRSAASHPWCCGGSRKETEEFLQRRAQLEVAQYHRCLNFAALRTPTATAPQSFTVAVSSFFDVPVSQGTYITSLVFVYILGFLTAVCIQTGSASFLHRVV